MLIQILPEGKIHLPKHPQKTEPASAPGPTFLAAHYLWESRDSGLGSEGGCRRAQRYWSQEEDKRNDKKEQLFVKGNLRQAQSSSPNPRLMLSQGRGPPKVRESGGRQIAVLSSDPEWVPSPMCTNNWCLFLPYPVPIPLDLGDSFHTGISFNLPERASPPLIPDSNFSNFFPLACSQKTAPVWA